MTDVLDPLSPTLPSVSPGVKAGLLVGRKVGNDGSRMAALGAVEACCAKDVADAFDDLVWQAKRWLKLYASRPERRDSSERKQSPVVPAKLSDYESERMAAVSLCLARLAAKRSSVRHFRRDVLGGERLTPEQARCFLRSPALRVLSRARCKDYGIPPVGHTAMLVAHAAVRAFRSSPALSSSARRSWLCGARGY